MSFWFWLPQRPAGRCPRLCCPFTSAKCAYRIPEAGHTLLTFYTFIHRGMFAPGWERIGPERTFTASALAGHPCREWEWTGTRLTRVPAGCSDLEMTGLPWGGKGVRGKVWGVFSNILRTRDSAGILWLSYFIPGDGS